MNGECKLLRIQNLFQSDCRIDFKGKRYVRLVIFSLFPFLKLFSDLYTLD